MKQVLIAFDSFKGSLTAKEACEALGKGMASVMKETHMELLPMADGGEGTSGLSSGFTLWHLE